MAQSPLRLDIKRGRPRRRQAHRASPEGRATVAIDFSQWEWSAYGIEFDEIDVFK